MPFRWLEHGSGPAVVLLHGIPTSPALWRYVAPRLHGVRTLAWELVGYGRSWALGAGRDISLAAQAGLLLTWMDRLQIGRAILVGHDIGGGVAQIAAARAPQRCAGLVLADAVAYECWPIPEVKALRAARAVTARLPPALLRAGLTVLMRRGHRSARLARESLGAHWPGYDHSDGAAVLVRQACSLDAADTQAVAPGLRTLDRPAAVVWGAGDPFLRLACGRRLAEDLAAPLDEIPHGRHFTPEDDPDRLVAAIRSVLARA